MTIEEHVANLIPIDDYAGRFRAAFAKAEEGFVEAAKVYCEAIDKYGDDARKRFAAACPRISSSTWRCLERLGSGNLDARLLMTSSCGAAALRRIPGPMQTAAIDKGVEVLIANGETLIVQIDNLTPAQARQVFSNDHIRDIAAQRAWLETNAPTVARPMVAAPAWEVKGGKVNVNRACSLTRLDLARMLAEMG